MKEWSLQKRVLFLALAPLTVAVLLLSLHFTNARIQDLENALRNRGQTIATQLAAISEDAFQSGNRQVLARFVQSTLQEKNVLSVTVTDMKGKVLAHASETIDKNKPPPLTESSRYKLLAPVYYSEGAKGVSKVQAGWVSVQLSSAALQTEQNKIMYQSLLIVFLGLVVTIVFALRMARGVTRPVLSLTRAVDEIKNGALDYRVSTQSGGEVGRLEDGINAMAAALQEARDREKKLAEDA
ncbi:MAG TPA: HAMP domain-containing protein, partial [Sulfuricaulis sp.]